MDPLVQDVLNVNIVFLNMELLNTPDAARNLENAANGDVLGLDIGLSVTAGGAPEPTRRIVLQRDRISIEVAPARSSVGAEFPQDKFVRLAEIVDCALENTVLEGREATYGYNMTLVATPDLEESAVKSLGDRLFSSNHFVQEHWERVGGLGTMYFWDGSRRWTFTIEPRPRDDAESKRFFMSINLHLINMNLPSKDDVAATFNEMVDEAARFVNQLITGD